MSNTDFDVVISGGGLVGLTLALCLSEAGLSIAVVEKMPLESQHAETFDGRHAAIAYACFRLWEAIGLGPVLRPRANPIDIIRITDAGFKPLHVALDDALELRTADARARRADEPLGYMIANRDIRLALYEKAKSANLTVFSPDTILAVAQSTEAANISLGSGSMITSRLLASAEGFKGTLASQRGIRYVSASYDRTALVTTLQTQNGHANIAYEHFAPAGPIALLPLINDRLCMVWVDTDAQTQRRYALPATDLIGEISGQLGEHFGALAPVGIAHTYPLGLALATRLTERRFVLVGDTAHKIHPVAGQGLNLGLKDVAALVSVLTTAKTLGQDIGSLAVLSAYAAWRAPEIAAMTAFTDGCVRLFESQNPIVRAGRHMAAGILRRQSVLRGLLVDAAGGSLAPIPKLMRAS